MSKAAYWQRGESLDYVNSGNTVIEAGSVVALAGRIGVAGMTIEPGEIGSLHVCGIYRFDKTSTNAIPMGTAVYFDGTGITENSGADGSVEAGYAAEEAAAESATILVKLLG